MQNDYLRQCPDPIGRSGAAHAGRYIVLRRSPAIVSVGTFVDKFHHQRVRPKLSVVGMPVQPQIDAQHPHFGKTPGLMVEDDGRERRVFPENQVVEGLAPRIGEVVAPYQEESRVGTHHRVHQERARLTEPAALGVDIGTVFVVAVHNIHTKGSAEAAEVVLDMRVFRPAGFVIHNIADEDDDVGMLGITEGDLFLDKRLTDDFTDVEVAHHRDTEAVAGAAPFRQGEIDVPDYGIHHRAVGMNHQKHIAHDEEDEEDAGHNRLIPYYIYREPMEETIAEAEDFEHEQTYRQVEGGDVPRIA